MTDEKKPEVPQADAPKLSPIEVAQKTIEDLKKENDRTAELLKQFGELKAVEMLGGQTDAGIQPEKPKEETPKEYVKRLTGE